MAGSAGGSEVGQISIRVVPDLDKFYDDLKVELERVEKTLKGEVPIEADTTGFREKVAAETKNLPDAKVRVDADMDNFQKRMLADISKMSKEVEPKINLTPDGERFRRAFDTQITELSKETKIKIEADVDLAAAQRAKLLAEVQSLKTLAEKTTIQLKIDPEKDFTLRQRVAAIKPQVAQTDLSKALAEVKAAAAATDASVKLTVSSKEADAQLAESLAKLKLEAKLAKVKITVDVDRKIDKGNIIGGIVDGLGAAGGAVGNGFKALTDQTVLLAVAVVSLLAPALALISGLLLALPSLIALIALPIGVVALGMKGLGEAAKVLQAPFKQLQQTLSKKFQDVFTPIFKQLAPLLPGIGTALTPIVDRLGEMAKAVLGVFTSGPGMKAFQDTLTNIGTTLSVMTPGIQKFTEGLLNLIAGGSKSLPGFGKIFTDLGTRFSAFVSKITTVDWAGSTSPLERALTNFQTVLQKIIDIVANLGKNGFDFLSDPNFGKSMTTFLDDLDTFVTKTAPKLADIFEKIAAALDKGTKFLDKMQGVKAPDWLSGDFVNNPKLGKTPSDRASTFGKNFDVAALNPFTLMGQWASDAFDSIDWSGLWTKAAAKINAFNPFLIIGTWIGDQFDKIDWGTLWTKATSINPFTIIGDWISTAFSGIDWGTLWSLAAGAFTGGANPFSNIGQWISEAFSGIDWGGIFTTALSSFSLAGIFTNLFSGVDWNGLWTGFTTSVSTAVDTVVSFFTSLPGRIISAIGSIDLSAQGAAIINSLKNGMEKAFESVKTFVSGIKQWIVDHKGPISADQVALVPAGQALMSGLQDGLEGGLKGVLDRASQMAGQIQQAINSGQPLNLNQFRAGLQKSMSELNLESKQLAVARDQTTDPNQKKALTGQINQVNVLKRQLSLQQDQLGLNKKNGASTDSQSQAAQLITQALAKGIDTIKGFASANIQQFGQDIGVGGHGAVEAIGNYGLGFLTQSLNGFIQGQFGVGGGGTQIHVNNSEDAVAMKQSLDQKSAMQFAGR